jgi:predicted MPP superfamily phosphohydrolase
LYFIVPFLFVLGMQFLHWKLLRQIFPDRFRRWLHWILLVIHLPLLIYMGYRFAGQAAAELGSVLRPLARGALYFQFFTLVNLFFWALALGVWKVRQRLGHVFDQGPQDPSRRHFLRKTAASGVGILAATGIGGAEQAYGDPEITRTNLWFSDLPQGLNGLRIVHLSDLHCGPLVGSGLIRRWRLLAERESPELLVITGDLVDSLPGEIEPFVEAFRDMPAPLGRFAILGNHDYFTDPKPIWAGLERAGFICLENRHVVVERGGAELAILGLQDPMARNGRFLDLHFGPGPMPQDVLAHLPQGPWRLCLCHRPSNWNLARETEARLTLAGHTHGGQINLIPGISSANMLGPYTSGLYRDQGQVLYVSRGLGVVGLPMRIGAAPELAVITLRRKEVPSMLPVEGLIE